jgi:hypothetical protein
MMLIKTIRGFRAGQMMQDYCNSFAGNMIDSGEEHRSNLERESARARVSKRAREREERERRKRDKVY